MSLIINDVIFLRRPTLNYVAPPVCENLFSSTGFPVIVLNPVPHHGAPTVRIIVTDEGFQLDWDPYPGAICYNVYKALDRAFPDGAYELLEECIPGTNIPVDPGCYKVSAITLDGESDLSLPACTPGVPSIPEVITDPESGVGIFTATLHGRANLNNGETTVYFEWGTSTSYGNTTAPQAIGSGAAMLPFSAALSGLSGATEYHFRAVATNSKGTAFGADEVFLTECDPEFPKTLPGLQSWWKADSLSLNDGDPISIWPDSNSTNDATGSGTTRPVFAAHVFGDKPVVRFDGVDDQLDLSSFIHLDMFNRWTGIVVFAWAASPNALGRLFGSTANNDYMRPDPPTGIAFWGAGGFGEVSNPTAFSSALTAGRAVIMRKTTGDFINFRENKTDLGSTNTAPLVSIVLEFNRFGVWFQASPTFKGDVAEIIVFEGDLSDADCDAIYDKYLKCKYTNLP